ncbi:FtsX-like permease family protein [Streptomyces sp. NPDC057746]|uniref:ABC transporter permease n=1 Tax=unclassified Streptomyces TaxID=2593676 RepID=UPI0033A2B8CC
MTGFVLLRVRAHWLLLGAALLCVVLTTCVIASLAAFSGAVGDVGLRRALQDQGAARTLVEADADVTPADRAELDAAVRRTVPAAFDGMPVRVAASVQSASYGLPRAVGTSRDADPDLTLLATLDPAQVTMTGGARPGPPGAGGPVPVALPEQAAHELGLHAGDRVTLSDRRGGRPLHVLVTGLYRPVDRTALYWRLDPLGGRGVRTLSFTTYGPMLADPRAFTSGSVPPDRMYWQARADFSTMSTARLDRLRHSVQQTLHDLDRATGGSVRARSELPDLLTDLRRTLLVSRSTVLISTLQVVLLAAFALLLVAGLLAGERAGETAQLRARGASRPRVAGLAAIEALLLALPAVVVAPLLAGPLLRLLAGHGPLARAQVRLDASPAGTWSVAAVTALVCALAVVGPALRRSGTYVDERNTGRRRDAVPGIVKAGADVALVVVAVLAYWQLSRRASGSGVLTVDTGGALGVDPVLVAAPALCLCAGAVLALRLLPFAARLGERRAAGTRGLTAALTGWQLSRRPGRGAGPVLLVVLSVAMGVFATGEYSSWARSQRDQADFAVGADLRVVGSSTPPFAQGGVYDGIPGIAAAAPAVRAEVSLPRDRNATVLAMDTEAAASVLDWRDDLTDRSPSRLLGPLHSGAQAQGRTAGFVLPENTGRLRITARLEVLGPAAGSSRSSVAPDFVAFVTDRYGVPYAFPLGTLPADGRPHVLTADFAAESGRAEGAAPAGPLRLTGINAGYRLPQRGEEHRLTVTGLSAVLADGRAHAVPVPAGATWGARVLTSASGDSDGAARQPRATAAPSTAAAPLSIRYGTGQASPQDPVELSNGELDLRADTADVPLPAALATDAFLRATGTHVGQTADISLGNATLRVRVTAVVRALPTVVPPATDDGGALLLDLRAVNRALADHGGVALQPGEWWLAADHGAAPRAATALRSRADAASVLVRDEERDRLKADPLGAGPQAGLPAAVVAAAVLAAVGCAVAAVGAYRERADEHAVLRALGASRRSLARGAAAEQGLLLAVAVAVGAGLGVLLTRLVVPLIVLTAQAERPLPALRVELPAGPVVQMLIAVTAVPLLVVVLTALRSGEPAQALRRQGGE